MFLYPLTLSFCICLSLHDQSCFVGIYCSMGCEIIPKNIIIFVFVDSVGLVGFCPRALLSYSLTLDSSFTNLRLSYLYVGYLAPLAFEIVPLPYYLNHWLWISRIILLDISHLWSKHCATLIWTAGTFCCGGGGAAVVGMVVVVVMVICWWAWW